MQLYFTEINLRYLKHCNGIFVDNDLITENMVSQGWTLDILYERNENNNNYIFILSDFLFLKDMFGCKQQ